MSDLTEFETTDPLTVAVEKLFGLSYLFPYQRLVISNILEAAQSCGLALLDPVGEGKMDGGKAQEDEEESPEMANDLGRQLVILPTGAGKTLCFQLPAMFLPGATLVIFPILSLMADQERRMRERGFVPALLRGGQSREEREEIFGRIRSGKSKFIIANPEVLITPGVLDKLKNLGIVHIVIDEAHCVSEWGESFRPSYLEIGRIAEAAGAPLITAFTATASQPVLEGIERYIFGGAARRIIGNPNRRNVRYAAQGCVLRNAAVRDLLKRLPRPAIVFCASRSGTERMARYLRTALNDEDIRFYHAGLEPEEKRLLEAWFFRHPRAVLTATCAFGLGVDKADIRTVIHRDCPPSAEAYLQESGRAGRDGEPAWAVLLWGPPDDDIRLARMGDTVQAARFARVLAYARDFSRCRRSALMSLMDYEGQAELPGDDCCDVCAGGFGLFPGWEDYTAPWQPERLREDLSVYGFFSRNRRRYSINEAARVLAGRREWGLEDDEVRDLLTYYVKAGLIKKGKRFFFKDAICPTPRAIEDSHSEKPQPRGKP